MKEGGSKWFNKSKKEKRWRVSDVLQWYYTCLACVKLYLEAQHPVAPKFCLLERLLVWPSQSGIMGRWFPHRNENNETVTQGKSENTV